MKPSLARREMRSIEHARGLVLPQPLLFLGMPRIRSISSHAIVYVGFAPIASVVAAHRQLPSLVSIVLVPLLVISAGCALCYWVERPLLEAGRTSAERWFPKILGGASRAHLPSHRNRLQALTGPLHGPRARR